MVNINTNLWSASAGGIQAQQAIRNALNLSLERLYTGNRINRASDDPAGLADAVQVTHRISAAEMAVRNNQASISALATVEDALHLMVANLLDMRAAIEHGRDENDPVQQQALLDEVTNLIQAFDEHARSATAGTQTVLAGRARIDFGSQMGQLLDVDSTHVRRTTVSAGLAFKFEGAKAAEQAYINQPYQAPGVGGAQHRITSNGASVAVSLAAGATIDDAVTAINTAAASIGVTAAKNGANLVVATQAYGSAQDITIETVAGLDLFTTGSPQQDNQGKDGEVLINGRAFALRGDLRLDFADPAIQATFVFDSARVAFDAVAGTAPGDAAVSGYASGGLFLQSGVEARDTDGARFGFRDLTADALGLSPIVDAGDAKYMFTDAEAALAVVDTAYDTLRASLAELGTASEYEFANMNDRLGMLLEELHDRQSELLDTDNAYEAARLAKLQMLQQAGMTALSMEVTSRQSLLTLFEVARSA